MKYLQNISIKLIIALTVQLIYLTTLAQKVEITIADFDNKPSTTGWWIDNENVKILYDDNADSQVTKSSKSCLYIRWDSTPTNRPYAWFTDIKADTFATEGMEEKWKLFKENTWMSFWCKAGSGDTLMLHYLVLSKGHKSKWGSTKMLPLTAKEWTFVKVKFADLKYENWGVIKADFNLNSDSVKCFEVGLRLGSSRQKGYVEGWFDNIKLTNYEPFE